MCGWRIKESNQSTAQYLPPAAKPVYRHPQTVEGKDSRHETWQK